MNKHPRPSRAARQLSIRLSPPVWQTVLRLSEGTGAGPSEFVRALVEETLGYSPPRATYSGPDPLLRAVDRFRGRTD